MSCDIADFLGNVFGALISLVYCSPQNAQTWWGYDIHDPPRFLHAHLAPIVCLPVLQEMLPLVISTCQGSNLTRSFPAASKYHS